MLQEPNPPPTGPPDPPPPTGDELGGLMRAARVIRRRLWFILALPVGAVLLFTLASSETPPTYRATVRLLITSQPTRRALGGDGKVTTHPQSRVGSQQTPEQAAETIFSGACKRKNLLVLTLVGKLSYWISRLAPNLYERIMINKLKKELER